ncbi:phosphatase and actin regulator 4 isoform X2 [Spea bombifrons]|uniref:phosphatase and actin regulator 4 isoform X2 n=1 Tax=Spea bombifrons TaxID=233779 RepID=UPI00234BDF57|nr:phosphatase and actin regulator 4 isoform X2 [Spea bombifrons]
MMSVEESERTSGYGKSTERQTEGLSDTVRRNSSPDQLGFSTELSPSLRAPAMEDRSEEGDPQAVHSAPPTPPTKRKSKFAGIGKFFKPWKWRKRKPSDTFRETSEILERKISMRKPRDELVKRGVLVEVPEEDVPEVSSSPPLRNGHLSVVPAEPQEDEVGLKKNSRPDSTVVRPVSEVEPVQDVPRETSKQPLLPPKRPLSSSSSISQEVHVEQNVDSSPVTPRQQNSAPSPAPRTKLPPPVHKQPPIPPPKPMNRNSNPLMAELSLALGGTTLTPAGSRPSPPLPNKRGAVPPTDVMVNKEKTHRPISLPSPMVVEAPVPSPPSPPLPDHIPVAPVQEMPPVVPTQSTEEENRELPPNLPLLPLHIRIQQALSSPQPMPSMENGQRAHSLLFMNNNGGAGEDGTRVRSLPVTIELLKVPDDDDDDVSPEDDSLSPEQPEHASRVYIGDVPSVTIIPSNVPSSLQEEDEEDEGVSDSDSEGPILYKDDDDDEDEEETSSLANKVRRKDTLAMKLSGRSGSQESSTEIPHRSKEEWTQIREQIGSQLNRRLSQRPTAEELEQRNILIQKNEADRLAEKREIKRRLTRKLSQRPTVAELLERKILRFNEYVEVTDAHDYDRRADKPWTRLTPSDKAAIRKELNEFKSSEMAVHEESRKYIRFHRP